MYAYTSKKIALANQNYLHCAAWNKREGWLAIGGCEGLLKLIKIDHDATLEYSINDINRDLLINQKLEGHSGTVIGLAWNEPFQKLVSSDENGLTIVWDLQDDIWYQEMINNRNTSYVTDMKWTSDGTLICIIYNDGTVTVGSVEGSKVWGLEIGVSLLCVEWSPNNKNVIIITEDNKIKVFDKAGSHIKDITCSAIDEIKSIHWHHNQQEKNYPSLSITSITGQTCLKRSFRDANSTVINSALNNGVSKWNLNGSIIAICGNKTSVQHDQENCLVLQLYDRSGNHLYEMEISKNQNLIDLDWEVSGSRIFVTTEKDIYFVSVRQSQRWTTLNSNATLVYQSPHTSEKVIFFNTKSGKKVEKAFGNLSAIKGDEKYCVIIASSLESPSDTNIQNAFSVKVCDEIGTVWSAKQLKIHPDHVAMNDRLIVVSDHRNVYLYLFDSLNSDLHSSSNFFQSHFSNGRERMFDIHDTSKHPSKPNNTYEINYDISDDPAITAICVTPSLCLFGMEDNHVLLYSLPNITRLNRIYLECEIPRNIEINCDSTKFSVIDSCNIFQIFDLEKRPCSKIGVKSYIESSSVYHAWAMKWSSEDPDASVVLDKGKLLEIYLGETVEKHVILAHCDGYLIDFSNLEITLGLFDDMTLHLNETSKNYMLSIPSKILEDARTALNEYKIDNALVSKFSQASQKHVWKIISYKAVENLDFITAEKAFILSENYAGLLFLEKITKMDDQELQRAEMFKFIGKFFDAEKKYLDLNRPDLAIQMNMDLNEWSRMESLLGKDGLEHSLSKEGWSTMAEHFAKQHQYQIAAEYYENAGSIVHVVECLVLCQDYNNLERIVNGLTSKSTHLEEVTKLLLSNGKHKLAITCQKKVDNRLAMDTCINLNMWEEASSLANDSRLRLQLEKAALKKHQELLHQNNPLQAFRLCQCVKLPFDAANILSDFVNSRKKDDIMTYTVAKKVFILAAKQIERHRNETIDMSQINSRGGKKVASFVVSSIEKLMDKDNNKSETKRNQVEIFKNSWRSAAAHHYFLVAHQHLYNDQFEAAMKFAIYCCSFVDILNPLKVYSLITLASYLSGFFEVCSTALTKLKMLDCIDKKAMLSLQKLEFAIFTKQKPINKVDLPSCYTNCLETGKKFNACTITGKNITNKRALQCRYCHYYMLEGEARERRSCALCHGDCKNAEVVTILD